MHAELGEHVHHQAGAVEALAGRRSGPDVGDAQPAHRLADHGDLRRGAADAADVDARQPRQSLGGAAGRRLLPGDDLLHLPVEVVEDGLPLGELVDDDHALPVGARRDLQGGGAAQVDLVLERGHGIDEPCHRLRARRVLFADQAEQVCLGLDVGEVVPLEKHVEQRDGACLVHAAQAAGEYRLLGGELVLRRLELHAGRGQGPADGVELGARLVVLLDRGGEPMVEACDLGLDRGRLSIQLGGARGRLRVRSRRDRTCQRECEGEERCPEPP